MSTLERKRPREHDSHDDVDTPTTTTSTLFHGSEPSSSSKDDSTTSSISAAGPPSLSSSPEALPPYGSQDYWEKRYAKLLQDRTHDEEAANDEKKNPDPFHAWYFSFDELAPLILPLILGDGDGRDDEKEQQQEEVVVVVEKSEKEEQKSRPSSTSDHQDIDDNDVDEDVEDDDDDDDDEENEVDMKAPTFQLGIAHKGPISVMEVGCGDVPLGRDLLASLLELEGEANIDASTILKKVVCLDYSKNVIEAMKENQSRSSNPENNTKKSSIPLTYQVADARNLPYRDATFDLILEKGTLDAMLSDRDGNGPDHCRKIVAECARVATVGGCIVVISHLNAHCQTGLQWLNDIVVPGLRLGGPPYFEWSLEVHGNEADIPSEDDEDDTEEGKINSKQEYPESPGPAVYIMRKGNLFVKGETPPNDEQLPTIPLRFFSY
jgi:ubiquinone/menaquinone biosynthesis C-methylase UbiE